MIDTKSFTDAISTNGLLIKKAGINKLNNLQHLSNLFNSFSSCISESDLKKLDQTLIPSSFKPIQLPVV